ncbi:MAG: L,D-transpeptidase [Vampirovibrionales bacterium]|nr:L,D-transpeptidase [Vampirovibrionales bacterium]
MRQPRFFILWLAFILAYLSGDGVCPVVMAATQEPSSSTGREGVIFSESLTSKMAKAQSLHSAQGNNPPVPAINSDNTLPKPIMPKPIMPKLVNVSPGAQSEKPSSSAHDALKVVIHVPARQLSVLQGEYRIASYPVGVGRPQFPTPAGKFSIIRKIKHPGWENPYLAAGEMRIEAGQDNPLGTRWLGFKAMPQGEYGIHGTDNPKSVGELSSHGCVRMRIKDVEQLYDWVQVGTPVEVRYEPAWLERSGNQLLLTVYPSWFKQQGKLSADAIQRQIRKQFPTARLDVTALQYALKNPSTKALLIGRFDLREHR